MMRLTAIGTSGSFPGTDSPASCYLVDYDDGDRQWRVVLDLGNGAMGALQAYTELGRIDALVLSHLHADHCIDVTTLFVRYRYDPQYFCPADGAEAVDPRPALPAWAPAGAEARLTAAYHVEPGASPVPGSPDPVALGEVFDFRDLAPRTPFRVGPLEFEPFLVDHPVEGYAFRITDPTGAVLTYSGDTDECEELVAAAQDADLFLCEAAFQEDRDTARGIHLTGLRAGASATRAGARTLVLTHIPPWTDRGIIRAEAAGTYDGPIELAKPGSTWTVAADGPRCLGPGGASGAAPAPTIDIPAGIAPAGDRQE
ncbi:MBL fold metallo-hydrolase [Brevibacterium samyangense]|uniref:MBL fold metallo-hydrolase n=1 Tax=Brevibacterium samyangense TaxID=366888 RepID=A0ABN2TP09_9MICO